MASKKLHNSNQQYEAHWEMTEMSSTLLLLLRTSSGGPYFKNIYISNLNRYVSKSTGILDKIAGIHDVSSVNPEYLKLFNPVQIIFCIIWG